MKMIGVARLGNDAQVTFTPRGTPVAGLSLAFDYGQKGEDGKRPTQWIDAALFGKQAESLQPYLLKGKPFFVVLEDVHLQEYQRRDNTTGSKMVGKVASIEFVPGVDYGGAARQAPAQQPQQQRQPAPQQQGGLGGGAGFDDDIPFAPRHYTEA